MTFSSDERVKQAVQAFQGFDADTQLALLWYGYLDIKDNLTPVNATSSQTVAEAVFHQIEAMPQEEQLQAQRDIINHANSQISIQYGALDPSAKLDVWLRLAQAMERGSVIPMPDNYELPANTNNFVEMVKSFDFEKRIDFTRSVVFEMGARQGAGV